MFNWLNRLFRRRDRWDVLKEMEDLYTSIPKHELMTPRERADEWHIRMSVNDFARFRKATHQDQYPIAGVRFCNIPVRASAAIRDGAIIAVNAMAPDYASYADMHPDRGFLRAHSVRGLAAADVLAVPVATDAADAARALRGPGSRG